MSKPPVVIHNVLNSNFANLLIKYIYAKKLQRAVPGSILSNYIIRPWQIDNPEVSQQEPRMVEPGDDHRIDHERVVYLARTGSIERVNLRGHLQRMENLLPREECNMLFPALDAGQLSFGGQFVVCPVRGGEVLDARHPGYSLLPVGFYQEVIQMTGLHPVFMGQTEDNAYMRELRAEFPRGVFLPPLGPLADFETIRCASNLVLPLSTFSWLAAWLSNARQIVLPVFGLFNPEQYPDVDLLPLGDDRYSFYQFPFHHAVSLERYAKAHADLQGRWRKVEPGSFAHL